jgi:hypothetical protein
MDAIFGVYQHLLNLLNPKAISRFFGSEISLSIQRSFQE